MNVNGCNFIKMARANYKSTTEKAKDIKKFLIFSFDFLFEKVKR